MSIPTHIPVRMLNEFAYCPRLAYLEWVQGEWRDNLETLEGKAAHKRVDRAEGPKAKIHARSVDLGSETLGLVAKLDLIESRGGRVRPVDYKRGKRPPVREGAYEPERVQLCAQGLLLREAGHTCNEGLLYFVGSKERVRVRFTPQLIERTTALAAEMRERFAGKRIPPPLVDSPKCPRCSLVSICLPEETNFLRSGGRVRPLVAAKTASYPLIVQEPRAKVRKSGEQLVVTKGDDTLTKARLPMTSQVVVSSGAEITSAAIRACCRHDIPIVHMSGTGWLYGVTKPMAHKNVELRQAQFRAADDMDRVLPLSRRLVAAKILNGRVYLRRNGTPKKGDLDHLRHLAKEAESGRDLEALLGLEGLAARVYFGALSTTLKDAGSVQERFDANGRSKRPPRDPLNALLSFAYSTLVREWVTSLWAVGFDPMLGFYHRPRYGKPALALDLMEPFRPLIADSVAIGAINNGEIQADDFYDRAGGVYLKPGARKAFYRAFERRMMQQVKHPLFGYKCTYRRTFEIQARLLGRHLLGEIADYPAFRTR